MSDLCESDRSIKGKHTLQMSEQVKAIAVDGG